MQKITYPTLITYAALPQFSAPQKADPEPVTPPAPHKGTITCGTWLSITNLLCQVGITIYMVVKIIGEINPKKQESPLSKDPNWLYIFLLIAITVILPFWMIIDSIVSWVSCGSAGAWSATKSYLRFKFILYAVCAAALVVYGLLGSMFKWPWFELAFEEVCFSLVPVLCMFLTVSYCYGQVVQSKSAVAAIWMGILVFAVELTIGGFLVYGFLGVINQKKPENIEWAEAALLILMFIDVPVWSLFDMWKIFFNSSKHEKWLQVKDKEVIGVWRQIFTFAASSLFLNLSDYNSLFMLFVICHSCFYFITQIVFLTMYNSWLPPPPPTELALKKNDNDQ